MGSSVVVLGMHAEVNVSWSTAMWLENFNELEAHNVGHIEWCMVHVFEQKSYEQPGVDMVGLHCFELTT